MILAGNKSDAEDKVDLQDLSHYTGQLTKLYPAYKKSSSTGSTYKFVALEIDGLDEVMGVYRPEQNYSDMFRNVKIGDTVKIYYRHHSKDYDKFISGVYFNSDIYQLDINQNNYLKIDKVKETHSKGNIAVTIIAIFMFLGAIFILFKG